MRIPAFLRGLAKTDYTSDRRMLRTGHMLECLAELIEDTEAVLAAAKVRGNWVEDNIHVTLDPAWQGVVDLLESFRSFEA